MKTYRIQFKLQSRLTQIPDSQTIFGAFCFGIKAIFGQSYLESLLANLQLSKESLIVSSMFLHDTLPMPMNVEPKKIELETLNPLDFQKIKKLKKVQYISLNLFKQYLKEPEPFLSSFYHKLVNQDLIINEKHHVITEKSLENYFDCIDIKSDIATRNHVSLVEDEKSLFYTPHLMYTPDTIFDVYLKTTDELWNDVHQMLTTYSRFTMGPKGSIGYNLFTYHSHDLIDFNHQNSWKVLLSKAKYKKNQIDIEQSFYQSGLIEAKYSNYIHGKRYKTPFVALYEGSVVKTDLEVIGEWIKDQPHDMIIYHHALGFLV